MGQDQTQETGLSEGVAAVKVKYRKPTQCPKDMRNALTANFEAIVQGFIEEAKKGSCPHVKAGDGAAEARAKDGVA